ncbi:hypothetical protein [Leifsonia sp. Leaf264]|uniref:hypothetical protein n=1 Tax=Leifsonia sp. Leaf264 TaxID=1736314 RepID=UPI000B22B8F0|nr:hypothetical protein [Leifsonia sp. Leaf264]
MYAALWRALPGPRWVKAITMTVGFAAAIAALGLWVFPWLDATFLTEAPSVG